MENSESGDVKANATVVSCAEDPCDDDTIDSLLTTRQLMYETLSILIPADISSIMWMSCQSVTMMFVGSRLGSDALAQYSVGLMVFNICGISLVTGLGSAMDTLASQAYGRDPLSPEIGEALQRALVMSVGVAIPVTLLLELVVVPLQIPLFGELIGTGSAEFLRWSPLYLLPLLIGASIRRLMLATCAADLVAYANTVAAIVSPLANMSFTHLGVGVGAILSLSSIALFNALTYVLLCMYHPKMACARTARWPVCKNLLRWQEVRQFLALGIPSMIAMCAEWWAFDVQQVFTAYVSADAVAAFGICMSAIVCLFSVALGISIACNTLVGNALGARKPNRAKQYVRFLLIAGVVLSSCMGLLLWASGDRFPKLFTSNEAVIRIVVDAIPILALCHIGDTVQFSLQGFFRGAGETSVTAVVVLLTLWLVGLPVGGVCCLVAHLGTKGVFLGLLAGFAFEVPVLVYFMSRWDWDALALRASTSPHTTDKELDSSTEVVVIASDRDAESATLVKHHQQEPAELTSL